MQEQGDADGEGDHRDGYVGAETRTDPFFGLNVPVEVPGVPTELLDPRETWDDKDACDQQARKLAHLFAENFKKFEDHVDEEVKEAGPTA